MGGGEASTCFHFVQGIWLLVTLSSTGKQICCKYNSAEW